MTKTEAKHEFSLYFSDLKANAKAEGYKVDRQTEWRTFLESKIENGDLPEAAREWKL